MLHVGWVGTGSSVGANLSAVSTPVLRELANLATHFIQAVKELRVSAAHLERWETVRGPRGGERDEVDHEADRDNLQLPYDACPWAHMHVHCAWVHACTSTPAACAAANAVLASALLDGRPSVRRTIICGTPARP